MTAADPLANLKDIHLPPPVSAWPPAPGWWLLAALILLLVCVCAWQLRQWWRRRAYRRAALRDLRAIEMQWQRHSDNAQLQRQINRLLKQVALSVYPRAQVAALHGDAWLQFLDARVKQPLFTQPALQNFASLYGAETAAAAPGELLPAARTWIRRHR